MRMNGTMFLLDSGDYYVLQEMWILEYLAFWNTILHSILSNGRTKSRGKCQICLNWRLKNEKVKVGFLRIKVGFWSNFLKKFEKFFEKFLKNLHFAHFFWAFAHFLPTFIFAKNPVFMRVWGTFCPLSHFFYTYYIKKNKKNI